MRRRKHASHQAARDEHRTMVKNTLLRFTERLKSIEAEVQRVPNEARRSQLFESVRSRLEEIRELRPSIPTFAGTPAL